MSDIDHKHTNYPVCPHCAYENRDGWEWFLEGDDTIEVECPECERPYRCGQYTSVSYSTGKIEP